MNSGQTSSRYARPGDHLITVMPKLDTICLATEDGQRVAITAGTSVRIHAESDWMNEQYRLQEAGGEAVCEIHPDQPRLNCCFFLLRTRELVPLDHFDTQVRIDVLEVPPHVRNAASEPEQTLQQC